MGLMLGLGLGLELGLSTLIQLTTIIQINIGASDSHPLNIFGYG